MSVLEKIQHEPQNINFQEVIQYIDEHYQFTPTRFQNGSLLNESNQNNGSCKIFSFAQLMDLNPSQTLQLFGDYYRIDVLKNQEGVNHPNIRNFIKTGWEGISFEGEALTPL